MNSNHIENEAPFGHSRGPHLTGEFAPVSDELVLEDLPVEGVVPKDLNGVYLRNGPNPRFEPKGSHHFFDGDGMLHAGLFRNGKLTHHVPIELPGDRLMHDIGVTQNYLILHDVTVYHDEDALKAGRHKIVFDASLKTRFGVIPRHGAPDSIKWFEFSPCFLYHTINS